MIGLSLVLIKFVFFYFRYSAEVQTYGRQKVIWVVIWANILDISTTLPVGYQLRQRFSELGGPTEPEFGGRPIIDP